MDTLRIEIQELEAKKRQIQNSKLKNILQVNDSTTWLSEAINAFNLNREDDQYKEIKLKKNDKELIKILMRNGYIAEDYLDYISIFYEGYLTRSDNQFLISVKGQGAFPYDYKLQKVENLITRIDPGDFDRDYVLNYDLLDYMIGHPTNPDLIDRIFKKLSDFSSESFAFIDGFTFVTTQEGEFFRRLTAAWTGLWKFSHVATRLSDERKRYWQRCILEYGELHALKQMAEESNLVADIQNDPEFLLLIPDEDVIRGLIRDFELKFAKIDFDKSPESLLRHVYDTNSYTLNEPMVAGMLKLNNSFDLSAFSTRNYDAIRSSKCVALIDYVEANINEYIHGLYLTLDSNKLDPESKLIELLTNDQVIEDNKKLLLNNTGIVISTFDKIPSVLWGHVLITGKIAANWPNLQLYFINNSKVVDDNLIEFLNVPNHAKELSDRKIPHVGEGGLDYFDLGRAIFQHPKISDEAFELLILSSAWWYADLDLTLLNDRKIKILIDTMSIEPSRPLYEYLKSTFKGQTYHIRLIERFQPEYFAKPEDFPLDANDINSVLKSGAFTGGEKSKILDFVGNAIVLTNFRNLITIAELMKADAAFTINDELFQSVITNADISIEIRIRTFINHSQKVQNSDTITAFLNSLAAPYAHLVAYEPEIEVAATEINTDILDILIEKKYILDYKKKKEKIAVYKYTV